MALAHQAGFRPRLYTESAWYWPIAAALARFDQLTHFPSPAALTALYAERTAGLDLPDLRFVAAQKPRKPRAKRQPIALESLYEGRVIARGEVPTRPDDWHDLFNALAFVAFPRAKRALHARQYAIMKERVPPGATRLPNARTREQDALSLFDEGGIAIAVPPGRIAEFGADDAAWLADPAARAQVCVVPFGHALHEHLAAGLSCPLGTLHVVPVAPAGPRASFLTQVDEALAASLADHAAWQLPSAAKGSALDALPPPPEHFCDPHRDAW